MIAEKRVILILPKFLINFGIKYEVKKVDSGDYTAYIPNTNYECSIAIERKNYLDEISQNLTKNKARFEREFDRAKKHITIAIEDNTYSDLVLGNYKSEVNPKSFIALLHSITDKYNVNFIFIPKDVMAVFIYKTLYYNLRNILKGA